MGPQVSVAPGPKVVSSVSVSTLAGQDEFVTLATRIEALPFAGGTTRGGKARSLDKKTREGLEALGLITVGDLLRHYPRRYEDRTRFDRFPNQQTDQPLCLKGEVTDTQQRFMPGRRRFFEATVEDPDGDVLSGKLVIRFFNMPYIQKIIAVGQELVLYGQPKQKGRRLVIDHPDYEIIDSDAEAAEIHMDRITPIYPLTSGVNQRDLRALLFRVLETITDDDLPNRLPEDSFDEAEGWYRARAIREVHFPQEEETLRMARRYLALEEFALLQRALLKRRAAWEASGGEIHAGPGQLLTRFLEALPFEATGAQQRAIAEVRGDLMAARPMNRLLQGDVGSGKTLVATAAMLLGVEAGFDAAFMAPTQILAEQHFQNLQGWLEPLGVTVKLRTGSRKEEGGALPLFAGVEEGEASFGAIVVGTHALIHGDGSDFDRPLGVVVIDEQHKFGVSQRQALADFGSRPDVLIMTATPIPRTLTLSIYGDLDVSIIDELPAGRGKIITGIRDTSKLEAATQFVRDHLAEGRQAYLVYPLIDESEKVKSAAAAVEFEKWESRFEGWRCGLLHGRLSPEEKNAVMTAFRAGDIQVLVSTTVIEVGVDVPNANLMLIFNAERFGLAQLHQLRGRIGRGEHKSYCILMIDPENLDARERLGVLEKTRDGFRIAEADLEIRGPGEVLGTVQSGLPDLAFPEFLTDSALIQKAREVARQMEVEERRLESTPS